MTMPEITNLLQVCITQHQTGNLSLAAQGYAAILQADPGLADAWHLSGVLAHQMKRSQAGLTYIERAIQLNPQVAEYHANRAAVLTAMDQVELALRASDRSLQLDSGFGPAHFQRGVALMDLSRVDEALESFTQAHESGHSPSTVWRQIGLCRQYTGDIPESIEALEKSLAIDPRQPSAYFHLSRLVATGQYAFSDVQVNEMNSLLLEPQQAADLAGRLHFALAAHCERRHESADAFQHYKLGNDLLRHSLEERGVKYVVGGRQMATDELTEFFQAGLFRTFEGCGISSSRPIFVVGMPRSGTTLVEKILDSHPAVVGAGELLFMGNLVSQRFATDANGGRRASFPTLDGAWIGTAATQYLAHLDRFPPASRLVDKMPGNYLHLGFIRLLFPQATIIHCRRDPRDVCFSAFGQLFKADHLQLATSRIDWITDDYRQYARLMRHWQTTLPAPACHDVFYEKLVQNPPEQVRRLLEHCELEWSDRCLDFHTSSSTVRTASSIQVRQPIYSSSCGRWRHFAQSLQPLTVALRDVTDEYEELLAATGDSG